MEGDALKSWGDAILSGARAPRGTALPRFRRLCIRRRALLALLLLSSCTGANEKETAANRAEPDAPAEVRLFTFEEAPVVPGRPVPTYHMAAISGRLVLRHHCVTLDTVDGRLALVFKQGSVVFEAATETALIEGVRYPIGTPVAMGGPGGPAVQSLSDENIAARCGADGIWLVAPGTFERQPPA